MIQRLFIIVLFAFPSFAFAQQSQRLRDRDPHLAASLQLKAEMQQATFHYGQFYFLSRIRLSDLGYTEAATLPTGEQGGSIRLSVAAPQRLYYVPHRKTVFTAEVTPGYSFSDRDGQFEYGARADAHFLFNHLYLDAYTTLTNQLRAYVSDFNRLATTRETETGIAGELKYSSRTRSVFSLRHRENDFPENRLQPLDVPKFDLDKLVRKEKNARLALHHKTFPRTSLFVAGEFSDYDFTRIPERNSRRTVLGAGLLHDAGRTDLQLEAGVARLDFDDPAQLNFEGVTGSIGATRSGRRWTAFAGAERDLGFSIFEGNNYYVANVFTGRISYESTRRLGLRTGTTLERDEFDVPVDGRTREDTMSFTYVGFLYSFTKLQTGLDVGWYERKSNFDATTPGGGDTSGIRYVLHLSFTP